MPDRPRAFLFALAATCTAPAAGAQDVDLVEPSANAPRGKVLEWKSAQARPYWYRLPKAIAAKDPPDLLLMLHGTGLDHRWSFANYPVTAGFRPRDIVVSPDGLTPGGTTFNFVQGKKDGEQIVGLIADFKRRFPIGRVYLYGHSQGAFFCYWFAGEHPELVDGIVAHAGNVLDVRHDKLAKEKVAIGILHGRADAVVPVDCAIRTERIYREQGYKKLKLEIVEGLTEQSGHWPLPQHVGQMLAWLDQVSAQSSTQALHIVAAELQATAPDLATVVEQVKKARELLPKAGDDREALTARTAAVQAFVDKALELHAQALLASGEVLDPKAVFGPWALHFARADAAFGSLPEWKKQLAKARALATAHEKALDKAAKALAKNAKGAPAAALRALGEAFLAPSWDGLANTLQRTLADADGGGDAAAGTKLEALRAARAAARKDADEALAAATKPALDELRAAAPELFATAEDDAGK